MSISKNPKRTAKDILTWLYHRARRAKIKQNQAASISKRARPLGREYPCSKWASLRVTNVVSYPGFGV